MASSFKDFLLLGLSSGLNILLGLLTTPLITRLVEPSDYGDWSIFNIFANVTFVLFGLGYDQVLVRYFCKSDNINYQRNLISKCTLYPIVTFLIALIPISILLYLVSNSAKVDALTYAIFVFYIIILLINRISLLALRFTNKMDLYATLTVLHKVFYVTLALGLICLTTVSHFTSLVLATVFSCFLVTLISIVREKRLWNLSGFKRYVFPYRNKELLSYGLPLMLAGSVYTIFQVVDKVMLKLLTNSYEVGIYASAMSLIAMFAIVQSSFNTLWWPAAMKHHEKNGEDKSFYIRNNERIALIMFLIGGLLVALKDVFVLLLGEKYRGASSIIPFLMFQPIMYTISETTVVGITIMKKSTYQLFIVIMSCLFNIIGNYISIPIYGPTGAALSTGISYILFFSLRTYFSNRFFKIDFTLNKMIIGIGLLFSYSLFTSFNDSVLCSVIFLLLFLIIMCIIYKKTFCDLCLLTKTNAISFLGKFKKLP